MVLLVPAASGPTGQDVINAYTAPPRGFADIEDVGDRAMDAAMTLHDLRNMFSAVVGDRHPIIVALQEAMDFCDLVAGHADGPDEFDDEDDVANDEERAIDRDGTRDIVRAPRRR